MGLFSFITGDDDDGVVTEETRQDARTAARNEQRARTSAVVTSPTTASYPSDASAGRQPHSVVFYINARSNSAAGAAAQSANAGTAAWNNAQGLHSDQQSRENRASADASDTVMAGASAVAGGALATAIGPKLLGDNASKLAVPLVAAGSAIVGAVVGGSLTGSNNTVRLLGSIQLHISQAPVTAYSANWDEETLGTAAGLLASGRAGLSDILGGAEYLARGVIGAAANIPKELGIGDQNIAGAIEATSKKVANPYKEQLFKSMGFRKFSFEYKFMPKNAGEYNTVQGILKQFRLHMHPDKGQDGFFLIYPSEFNIEYRYKGGVNGHIARIASCVLTDMKITYGSSDGTFNTIKGTGGAPNEINMLLSFTELETLTTDRIEDGL
jgi:hypothetical protein